MGADVIAQLVIMYGLPFAGYLVKLWTDKTNVGTQEWQNLLALVQTPETALAKVAEILGLPADDPKVAAIARLIV